MAVAVEVAQVHGVDAHFLEHYCEIGRALEVPFHCFDCHRHVPMAGKRKTAGNRHELIAMRIAKRFLESLLAFAAAEQVEDSEALLGLRRRIEPRLESSTAVGNLANAESKRFSELQMIAAKPAKFQIIGPVTRKLILVGRRQANDRTVLRFGTQSTVSHGHGSVDG